MTKRQAFSLIELSVVLIIIGLLIVGVTRGVSIVKSSRLAAARIMTAKSKIAEISDLAAWYETSLATSLLPSETVDESQITTWYDSNPSSLLEQKNTLSKSAGSDLIYRSNGINHLPSLEFNYSTGIKITDFYQGWSAQNTVFIVFSPTAAPNSALMVLVDSDASHSTSSIGIKSDKISLDAGTTLETGTAVSPLFFDVNGSYIIAAYFDSTRSRAYSNNATTAAGGSPADAGPNSLNGLTVGANKDSSNSFQGLISEVIIFNRVLQIDERKSVMSYLSKKYRIYIAEL